jgi:hypothetical protein
MTHDPMCPCTPTGFDIALRARDEFCQCDLIAKVRADERADALQDAWAEVAASSLSHFLDRCDQSDDCSGCDAVKRAVLALNRLRGES